MTPEGQTIDAPETLMVFTTVPDEDGAVKLSGLLLQQRLAACVHALPAGTSRYRWRGRLEVSREITLIIKAPAVRYADLEAAIKAAHPYDLPEILAVPVLHGAKDYLNWIADETA